MPTDSHPLLHQFSTAVYHDAFPLLIASTDSLKKLQENVDRAVRNEPGWTGIGGLDMEKWKDDEVVMERQVEFLFS